MTSLSNSGLAPSADAHPNQAVWLRSVLIVLGVLVAAAAWIATLGTTDAIDREDGPIEEAQFVLWGFSAVIALALAWRLRDKATRWFTAWLGVCAALAGARELDLHEKLNPETLGAWGVRYRLDWWTDLSVPLLPKLAWAVVGLAIGAAFILPILRAGPAVRHVLATHRVVLGLGISSIVFLAIGWASDDLLRIWTTEIEGVMGEELAELLGAACYALAVVLLLTPRSATVLGDDVKS
ncbi:MAG: hypothetical protein AAGG07_13830 [Planctomycetota bacterium]